MANLPAPLNFVTVPHDLNPVIEPEPASTAEHVVVRLWLPNNYGVSLSHHMITDEWGARVRKAYCSDDTAELAVIVRSKDGFRLDKSTRVSRDWTDGAVLGYADNHEINRVIRELSVLHPAHVI